MLLKKFPWQHENDSKHVAEFLSVSSREIQASLCKLRISIDKFIKSISIDKISNGLMLS